MATRVVYIMLWENIEGWADSLENKSLAATDDLCVHVAPHKTVGTGVLDCPRTKAFCFFKDMESPFMLKDLLVADMRLAFVSDSRGRLSLRVRALPLRYINHNLSAELLFFTVLLMNQPRPSKFFQP
mgnify:CR=1 FL=1